MRLEFHELEVCSMEMMLSISLPDIFKQMETSTFEEVNLSLPLTSFLVAQKVKRLLTVWETWFDPWVGKILWRRKWQPTPLLLPGKSHGQRSMVGYSPRGRKELDMTD